MRHPITAPEPTMNGDREFVPSGLVVLRTPLLPMEEIEAWSADLLSPGRPGDVEALQHDRALLRRRLQALLERPEVREALFLASPDLTESLAQWQRDPDGKKGVLPRLEGSFRHLLGCGAAWKRDPAQLHPYVRESAEPVRGPRTGALRSPLAAGVRASFPAAGSCGIPAEARALAMNVSVVDAAASGNLVVFPSGAPVPQANTVSFRTSRPRAGSAVVALGVAGEIDALSTSAAHLVVDVTGYFVP